MAVSVNLNAKGVPVTIVGGTGVVTLGPDGKIPSTELHYGSPGDPAGPLGADGKLPADQAPIEVWDYQGKWDASTNTPTLAAGVGTVGHAYIVSVAGSQDLGDGTVAFNVGDAVVYDGAKWDQIPHGGQFFVQIGGQSSASPLVIGTTTAQGIELITGGDPRITIDSIGNVGIDIDSPMAPLHVGGGMLIEAGTVEFETDLSDGTQTSIGNTSNHPVSFIANNTVHMTLDANGQILGGSSYVPSGTKSLVPKDYLDAQIAAIPANPLPNSPTAMVGPAAVAGSADTFMRSDAAPAINLTATYAWTGAHTFGSNVTVAGSLASAANTSAPSPTNSGIALGGAPTWAMASFYDQALTANNRTADLLFISNSIKFRFANDARNAFLDVLSINGGQALGVTGITSTSGSGSWTHTGGFVATSSVSAGNQSAANALQLLGSSGTSDTQMRAIGTAADISIQISPKGAGTTKVAGKFSTTGSISVVTGADGNKQWLAKYDAGTGHTDAPKTLGAESTYLQVGGREFASLGFSGIGFGYVSDATQNPCVWVGHEEIVTSGNTNGDFLVATRATDTNVAPTERLRITATGDAKFTNPVKTGGYTVATLPVANTGLQGARAYVTDAAASPAFLGAVAGGGTVIAPVICNGTAWVYG